ncbi:YhdP family protein [Aliivibrio sp. S4TY2]|uniref:YhdP family protein n=1 Tax=unclassified Aliivibrio TaxID=2645654 RepID=UPI0023797398|nr:MULTISPECIES: YhdP family protein [unclassified Aliivibrio]MDD9157365.1 YhdP family protein [Aliivibrio sp. S4TY2]MDD9161247.1 YhdP family protein [Aliivibrio sp. S4TY1]MDD9165277.1 YhdP family protein [Aliivibrio sp. S4MY2]MDD9169275.1 YhdP family protein [Aliivibrio sp. S4MY4]MDD9185902.1 YhdP family protein [Aliivibrio sp. S4MY3]
MTTKLIRFERCLMGLLLLVFLLAALVITSLRLFLPSLNQYQPEIEAFLSKATGFSISIGELDGRWRNTNPSLNLQKLKAIDPVSGDEIISVKEVEIQLNILSSLWARQPQFADLRIDKLNADLTSLGNSSTEPNTPKDEAEAKEDNSLAKRLEDIFLVRLNHFSVKNSQVAFVALDGTDKTVQIDSLQWRNERRKHLAEGVVSVVGSEINQLKIIANFKEKGTFKSLDGHFYIEAKNIQVTPWITEEIKKEYGVTQGEISANAWLSFKDGQPIDALVEASPSYLNWIEDKQVHQASVEGGVFELQPDKQGWKVFASDVQIKHQSSLWPKISGSFTWQPEKWILNLIHIDLKSVLSLKTLLPASQDNITDLLTTLDPKGSINDIRVEFDHTEGLSYSASIHAAGMQQWELLPGFHKLDVLIAGDAEKGEAKLSLVDDTLPYGDVFQAPLNITHGDVSIYWEVNNEGWCLWSDYINVATPDLQAKGEFRLDFPKDKPSVLSFYVEADAFNADQTWRYLPTLALGQDLTDYLSSAVQGGSAKTVQLLWYGELGDFPYTKYDGIFQVKVGLKNAQFSFDTAWPPLTNLQLDLLFQNASMFLSSHSADLMDVHATRVTGRIANLSEDGKLTIRATANGSGKAVREYMTATPLVDSVGAALNSIHVNNRVDALLRLDIPFTGEDVRAWGYADLAGNHIELQSPNIVLTDAKGRIEFDNDVVKSSGIKASLLGQPVTLSFDGEAQSDFYSVAIETKGKWKVSPLKDYIDSPMMEKVSGVSSWSSNINLQVADVGFTYQIGVNAALGEMVSTLPYPLMLEKGTTEQALLQVSGNSEKLSGRLTLPNTKYQAEINISSSEPVITASHVIVGRGNFKVSPVVGQSASINTKTFDLDTWLSEPILAKEKVQSASKSSSVSHFPTIPTPTRIDAKVKSLRVASLDWNDVSIDARKKSQGWYAQVQSQEVDGKASWKGNDDLLVQLDNLHIYIPSLDKPENQRGLNRAKVDDPLISEFDREFFRLMPNLELTIRDTWIQGYKLGKVDTKLHKKGDAFYLDKLNITSGENKLAMSGSWVLNKEKSHSAFKMTASGKNNSELLARFGISSGVQKASYSIDADLNWDGAPWSIQVNTLSGSLASTLGEGIITDVKGAARFLGLFSIDSIIRKMKLDFRDVFDDGMAFNSITGSGKMREGIFVSNNLTMDAVAGEMIIKGKADLNTRLVDAEVKFTPDLTSGIPIITAFAVAPQTAIIVLAVATAIAPVIDVITQVNYKVEGPLESPTVKELSRSQGEYQLPEKTEK